MSDEELKSPVLYKFTNYKESPELDDILAMFYHGAYENTVGIMQAFNLITEEEEVILVGVTIDEDGKPDCFPLAKLLKAEEVPNYLAPNGNGGFFDLANPSDVAEVKENMRPHEAAVVKAAEEFVDSIVP